ncbi:hypothetical protein H7I00_01150, partial [Mycobacterium bohemicum]|nr:hypothetical protein [Mycobacterium bohemicum]
AAPPAGAGAPPVLAGAAATPEISPAAATPLSTTPLTSAAPLTSAYRPATPAYSTGAADEQPTASPAD